MDNVTPEQRELEISPAGIFFSILTIIIVAVVGFKVMGWWGIIVSPIFMLIAGRPAKDEGPCAWERYKETPIRPQIKEIP